MNTTQLIAAKSNAQARKRLYTIKRLIDVAGGIVTLAAYDPEGKPIEGFHLRVDCNKLSAANQRYAMLFGVNQSVGDTAALGQGATLKAKFDEMRQRAEHLESGTDSWTSTEPGDGGLLVQAIMRYRPALGEVKVRALVKEMTRGEKDKWMRSEKLREIIDALRAERGSQSDVDIDAELAELEEMGG